MIKIIKFVFVLFLFGCFIAVRAFEYDLFFDPFLKYFENDHLSKPIPEVPFLQLFTSYLFRFTLNSIISFAILLLLFPKQFFLKTIVSFYILAFIILSLSFFGILWLKLDIGYLLLFYIRRFIIHPVFIIILLPFLYLTKKRIVY